jgi:hypothetical protein
VIASFSIKPIAVSIEVMLQSEYILTEPIGYDYDLDVILGNNNSTPTVQLNVVVLQNRVGSKMTSTKKTDDHHFIYFSPRKFLIAPSIVYISLIPSTDSF